MQDELQVRLDKWLWAARFYKTRALAKAAIEGGKVHYDGQRLKPGRIVQRQVHLTLRLGADERASRPENSEKPPALLPHKENRIKSNVDKFIALKGSTQTSKIATLAIPDS